MKNISIISFINTIFLIATIFVLISFKLFIDMDIKRFDRITKNRYAIIANSFLSGLEFIPTDEQIKAIVNKFDVTAIDDKELRLKIIREHKEFMIIKSDEGRVRIFKIKRDYYIYVQKFGYNLFFMDNSPKRYKYFRNTMIIMVVMIIILFLYLLMIRKLKPLKLLKKNVDRFGEGDLTIRVIDVGNDEIGEISKSFNNAVLSINRLIESKTLFMRNMMHELKTPVTKGMIITEMVEECENRKLLKRVFDRINDIINQLATIEKLNSNMLKLNLQPNSLTQMLNEAIRILIINEKKCEILTDNIVLNVDKELFVIVLKNLIHNGIKFSKNNKIYVELKDNRLKFISNSPPLTKPLSYYLEPFYQEEKRKDGLGIGLYIINSILKAHNLNLRYKYRDKKVIFFIDIDELKNK